MTIYSSKLQCDKRGRAKLKLETAFKFHTLDLILNAYMMECKRVFHLSLLMSYNV